MKLAVDLFSGAGGMSEGILQAGFHIVFSSDKSKEAALTYKNRHSQLGLIQGVNTHFEEMDIRDLTGDFILNSIKILDIFKNSDRLNRKYPIDAIFGGPPCQGFSRSGRRDPNDPRNFLFKEYLRVINELKPRYVVMENVEGMTDMRIYIDGLTGIRYDDTLVLDILKSEFDIIGYNTLEHRILDASDYGVPQSRRRVIFIAYLKGEKEPKYPEPIYNKENKITILDAIGDLIIDDDLRNKLNPNITDYQFESKLGRTLDINKKTIKNFDFILNQEVPNHSNIITERFSLYQEGETSVSLRKRIYEEGIDLSKKDNLINHIYTNLKKLNFNNIDISDDIKDLIEKSIDNQDYIIELFKEKYLPKEIIDLALTKKNHRKRLDKSKPSPTILTLPDDYISPFENRTLTVREMARLQSFDDSFEFLGKRTTGGHMRKLEVPQCTQVGNAVPPLLARAVAKEIYKLL